MYILYEVYSLLYITSVAALCIVKMPAGSKSVLKYAKIFCWYCDCKDVIVFHWKSQIINAGQLYCVIRCNALN